MVTQSDPGSKNFGIANVYTMLHQWHDPTLQGTLQHCWMHTKKNVMPEITWSQLCCRFTPGFENYLDSGVSAGWYDCSNTLQWCVIHFSYPTVLKDGCSLIFRWIFIPWLQRELDGYKDRINNTAKRHDCNKVNEILILPVFACSLTWPTSTSRCSLMGSRTSFTIHQMTLGHLISRCVICLWLFQLAWAF
jgi:hypothetical protein